MRFEACKQCRTEQGIHSFLVNLFMALFKGVLGVLTGSAALVADGLHSSADVIATSVTMVSVWISGKPASKSYAYGYGNIQFISAAIVGMILLLGALYLFVNATINIVSGLIESPNMLAVIGAIVSITMNQLLFHYQKCVGQENNSPAIMSNAWDNRSDALSSAAVLFGIIVAVLGFPIADPLAAIAVSLVIVKIAVELLIDAVNGLMDHSPDITELHEVYRVAESIEGVRGISSLKMRRHGEITLVDIGIKVPPDMRVYEGDLIALAVKVKVSKSMEHETDVQVFVGV
ncbi:MAG: magnetosome biogenesis CDF transporter MamB [SAR324 cluster bacterium]|nr:magnetosome biogenesis CDF transporter MamB [SAR324 cluster bacterium]